MSGRIGVALALWLAGCSQASLDAMGKTYQDIVRKAVDVLVLGIDVAAPKAERSKTSSRRRRR